MREIVKPISRGPLRMRLGKEYHILKRRWKWVFEKKSWASRASAHNLEERGQFVSQRTVFKHKSMILRPLKDVEMYLQENKRTNLRLAIEHLNNVVIRPGETFSIWKLVGRPTKHKGYLEGLVLKQGKIGRDIGGGLCQLGNLLFWIYAHSPLTVKERYRHGFDVFPDVNRKVPFGAGATLAYNHIDLQVKNETEFIFQLKIWMDETHLHGELVCEQQLESSYEVVERNHIMKQQIWGGYSRHNQIVQIETEVNGSVSERVLVENHAIMMYNPFLTESR